MDGKGDGTCKRCGHTVEVVTSVMPMGGNPGVFAWVCPRCGAADSVLVPAPIRRRDGHDADAFD
jgi:transcription elongation factor Elf1